MTNKIVGFNNEYRCLMAALRQDMKDYILMQKVAPYLFVDGIDKCLTYSSCRGYHDDECFVFTYLKNRIDNNLLRLKDLTGESGQYTE